MVSSTVSPLSVRTLAITSSTIYSPGSMVHSTVPLIPLGTMILWSTTSVSGTVPSTSPPTTRSPVLAAGV